MSEVPCPVCGNPMKDAESCPEFNHDGMTVIFAKFTHEDGSEPCGAIRHATDGWMRVRCAVYHEDEEKDGDSLWEFGKMEQDHPLLKMMEEKHVEGNE